MINNNSSKVTIDNTLIENKFSIKKLKLYNWLLIFLMCINLFSIIGYATFSLNTHLLIKYNISMELFNSMYYFSARMQIIASFLALAVFLKNKTQFSWIKELVFVFSLSLFMEWLGTSFGFPFGKYEYTELLGLKILNKVPTLIPISWFFMSIASYFSALKLQEMMNLKSNFVKGFFNVIFASVFLTAWDLTLDPAMSKLTPFWVWESEGEYFGTPIINFGGWLVTSIFIMIGFEFLKTSRLANNKDYNWFISFYLINLFLPLGLVISSGLIMPVALTCLTFSFIFAIVYITSLVNRKNIKE